MTTRGQGRIFQPKLSSFWWCAFYYGKEHRKVCRNRRTGAKREAIPKNLAEAEKYLEAQRDEVIGEKHGGAAFIAPSMARVTVGELLDDLIVEYQRGGRRRIRREVSAQMKSQLKNLREHFGYRRAVSVTDHQLDVFVDELLEDDLLPSTINRQLSFLMQAYRLAARSSPRKIAHPLHYELLDEDNVRKGKITSEQAQQIFDTLPFELADVARFAYETGARRGEILQIKWDYIDGDGINVPAAITKGRESHIIAFTPALEEIVARRRLARIEGCPWVFHRDGTPIAEFRPVWITACLSLGLGALWCRTCRDEGKYISQLDASKRCPRCLKVWNGDSEGKYIGAIFHDFRRSACHEMWKSGSSIEDCMAVSAHKTPNMFKRYADLFSDDEKRERQRKVQQRRREWGEQQIATMRTPSEAVN